MQLVNHKTNALFDLLGTAWDKKAKIEYPDEKGNRIESIRQIADRFREETLDWRLWFFRELIERGTARTGFAEYTLLK